MITDHTNKSEADDSALKSVKTLENTNSCYNELPRLIFQFVITSTLLPL